MTRVLIAMSDTGGGHRAMSSALAGSLRRAYGDRAEIIVEDVFSIEPRSAFERVTDFYGPCIRVAPWFYGLLYHGINSPRRYRAFTTFQRLTQDKLTGLVDRTRPDVIINTHPLANRPLAGALESLGRRIPVLASVSELVSVHTSWVDPRIHHYNTGTTESYQAVVGWGAAPDSVRCFGLPVHESFSSVTQEPGELRVDLGLDPERLTALLIGGGDGAGGIEAIVQEIQDSPLDLQLIVVCGRNDALRQRLMARKLRTPVHICGFVNSIPQLMHASDFVVTKGGPQTIAEALVVGRPLVLTKTIPGQEEGNGRFVESRGIGFAPGSVKMVVRNLLCLVENPSQRASMTTNARRLGRPDAAHRVAQLAMELAGAA